MTTVSENFKGQMKGEIVICWTKDKQKFIGELVNIDKDFAQIDEVLVPVHNIKDIVKMGAKMPAEVLNEAL